MAGVQKAIDVAAGESFSVACTATGEVYTWGQGINGKLGHGDQKDANKSAPVAGLFDASSKIIAEFIHLSARWKIYCESSCWRTTCSGAIKGRRFILMGM